MTVRCPRCGTLYRRPSRSALGADPTFRCARCRHVFDAPPDEPAMVAGERQEEDDDERFSFDEGEERAEDASEPEVDLEEAPAGRPRRAPAPEPASGVTRPARFAVRALVLVTLFYATLSLYLFTNPAGARALFRHVPLIGPLLVETRLHPTVVRLVDVRGEYQRVRGDSLVFIVSGKAVNDSGVPVRGIQVQALVTGAQTQRQVVFCGAAPRDVSNLSLREIALLQTIEPPKGWALPPGGEAAFMIVFPGPPTDLREFTAEVVAVRAPRRA